jgi:uncharacterized membrane protein YdcZ (DUF606 family)
LRQSLYLILSIVIGMGFAVQVSMVASMGRLRGPVEATWASLLATIAGVAAIMLIRTLNNNDLALPSPFDKAPALILTLILATLSLVFVIRGLDIYFALTGLLAIPILVGAGFLGPRIGVGLFLSAIITGQLTGGIALDHFGAFAGQVRRVDALRGVGVIMLLGGVTLIRGFK